MREVQYIPEILLQLTLVPAHADQGAHRTGQPFTGLAKLQQAGIQQRLMERRVLWCHQQRTKGLQAIPSSTAPHLKQGIQRAGRVAADHEAEVGHIHTDLKGFRGDQHRQPMNSAARIMVGNAQRKSPCCTSNPSGKCGLIPAPKFSNGWGPLQFGLVKGNPFSANSEAGSFLQYYERRRGR